MIELAANGESAAAPLAVGYAERTVRLIPGSVAAGSRWGSRRGNGDAASSVSTLQELAEGVPNDHRATHELESSHAALGD